MNTPNPQRLTFDRTTVARLLEHAQTTPDRSPFGGQHELATIPPGLWLVGVGVCTS